MHVRNIVKTELNGMILQHTQTLPEIVYEGCVICFLSFDGDIQGVGTRITDLTLKEFSTFKKLIKMIDFDVEEQNYAEETKQSVIKIKEITEIILNEYPTCEYLYQGDIDELRKNIINVEFLTAKLNDW